MRDISWFFSESEYDYADEENYLYTDGAYDGAYYYDEEYNAGKQR